MVWYFFLNSIFFGILLIIQITTFNNLNSDYLSLMYIILNIICSILSRRLVFSIPVLIVRVTGFIRYFILAQLMANINYHDYNSTSFSLALVELIAQYATFLYLSFFSNKKERNHVEIQHIFPKFEMNFIIKLLMTFVSIYFIYSPQLLLNFFSVSSNRHEYVHINGIVALLYYVGIVCIFFKLLFFIHRLNISNFSKLNLIFLLVIIYINGMALNGNEISRWFIFITFLVMLHILHRLYFDNRVFVIVSIVSIFIISIIIGTMYKFRISAGQSYSWNETLATIFSPVILNAYFSGPYNMNIIEDVIERIVTLDIFVPKILISDLFNNAPFLNKFLSDRLYTTVSLFNISFYSSTVATDQIIPLAGQLYVYFGCFFWIVTIILTSLSIKLEKVAYKQKNILLIYATMFLSVSLSLGNAINLIIMLQNLWIFVLPIIAVYFLDNRITFDR